MNATTLSQQFINAIHMQMLQDSSKLIHKNNSLLKLISIYYKISLTKMNRKIIQDIQWIITPISTHFSFIRHICPSNQWYQKLKINQRVENERKRQWHQILTWNPFKKIKNHGPTTDRKRPLWRRETEYKVLPSSSLPILPGPLDKYLPLSASHLLSEHTWSPHQARSWLLLESTQEENEFLPKPK